jgi:tryptophan 2,3-dioxygenase
LGTPTQTGPRRPTPPRRGTATADREGNSVSKLTYGSYLKIDELLSLQHPQSDPPHHDELLFIVIHQVYELWFLQMLHEIEAVMRNLVSDDLLAAQKNFRRIHAIQRVIETQVDVLETMTPQEFNAFRSGLDPASGFQSAQFREIEFLCGAQKTGYLKFLEPTDKERLALEGRLAEPTLYDALKGLLARRGFATESSEALIASYKSIYEGGRRLYDLYLLLEDFIEFDERFLLWRGRHVRMVERMIGMKPGTGGSLGVNYLEKTLSKKFFPELWAVRTELGSSTAY